MRTGANAAATLSPEVFEAMATIAGGERD